MKQTNVKSYDELPLFINADTLAKVLGVSRASAYELMREKDFPSFRIGKRILVNPVDDACVMACNPERRAFIVDSSKFYTMENCDVEYSRS